MSVIKLGHYSSQSWTVEQMLEDSLEDLRTGKRKANKALLIFLDNNEKDNYNTGFSMAHLKASEAIALIRVTEVQFLKLMDQL